VAAAEPFTCYIGWDSREAVASYVAEHSIKSRTKSQVSITHLKHRDLRKNKLFKRPWAIDADTGNFRDLLDAKPFSTEFSHTRFLVPALNKYKGWALFMDSDMLFQSDIKDLFSLCDDRYAVMCVKHRHIPPSNAVKMDGRLQLQYHRKNWSSFVLWNCGHSANKKLTPEYVNYNPGCDLHSFTWLDDDLIGAIPYRYNYISGISPALPVIDGKPDVPMVIHYTEGGPWFENHTSVPFGDLWIEEYEAWNREGDHGDNFGALPTTKYDRKKSTKKGTNMNSIPGQEPAFKINVTSQEIVVNILDWQKVKNLLNDIDGKGLKLESGDGWETICWALRHCFEDLIKKNEENQTK